MKQTNNAIKFLMAQYRAIFKNAYFKGMAITLGFDKPSAINTQEGRASFIRDCAATEILEDGNIGIKPPF